MNRFKQITFFGSIRSQLALNFTLAFGLTLVLTSFVCFEVFVRAHQANFDASLYNHAIDVASAIDMSYFGTIEIHSFPDTDFEKREPFSIRRSYMQLRNLSGSVLATTANLRRNHLLPLTDYERKQILISGVNYRTLDGVTVDGSQDTEYRLISYLVKKPDVTPLILQIAVPLTLIQENKRDFLLLLLFLIPTGIAVSSGLALWASRSAFYPVASMAKQTAQIQVKNLKDRIQVVESDPELRELGQTLNQLLDRIETSILAQDRFVADASHQMKTPLAIIQGELELLQEKTRALTGSAVVVSQDLSTELNCGLRNVSQEVSHLISLTENLLLLAKMDAGLERLSFQTVRLDEMITEVIQRLRRIADRSGIELSLELMPNHDHSDTQIDFETQGDSHLLRCLVENLIENAIKYSVHPGQRVKVCLTETSDKFVFEVKDQGRGFSKDEIANLYQRFQRDPKKSIDVSGSGLGLVIVKRIAELHRGRVSISSQLSFGSTATVELLKI